MREHSIITAYIVNWHPIPPFYLIHWLTLPIELLDQENITVSSQPNTSNDYKHNKTNRVKRNNDNFEDLQQCKSFLFADCQSTQEKTEHSLTIASLKLNCIMNRTSAEDHTIFGAYCFHLISQKGIQS